MNTSLIKCLVLRTIYLCVMTVLALRPTMAAHASEVKVSAPAGTHLMVKLDSTLDSSQHKAGHRFSAKLEGDIVVDNTVITPRGTTVYGQLTESKKSGRLAGKSEMQITLTQILINNQLHPISTSGVKAVTENSAKNTIGTTARGTAIGALAGGSDGAKTGAKIGAGLSILTRGNQINIPAGTFLDFTLAAPLAP